MVGSQASGHDSLFLLEARQIAQLQQTCYLYPLTDLKRSTDSHICNCEGNSATKLAPIVDACFCITRMSDCFHLVMCHHQHCNGAPGSGSELHKAKHQACIVLTPSLSHSSMYTPCVPCGPGPMARSGECHLLGLSPHLPRAWKWKDTIKLEFRRRV